MNWNLNLKLALAMALSLAASACGPAPTGAAQVDRIVSTTSFGMCMGYCKTRLEISQGQAVLVRESGGRGTPLPTQTHTLPLTTTEWNEIASLAAAAKYDGLPAVIGCPDCADGGAETLTVTRGASIKSVTFDHGTNVDGIQPLLDRVRAIRTKLLPKE